MASAFALAIFSGIGFLFGIQKSLRAFLNPLFTSRVVTENGICSAAFCESAALWAASSPSQALTRQLSQRESLQAFSKNSGSCLSIWASALPRWLMASFSSGVSWA